MRKDHALLNAGPICSQPKHFTLYHQGTKTPSERLSNPGLLGKGRPHRAAILLPWGLPAIPYPSWSCGALVAWW